MRYLREALAILFACAALAGCNETPSDPGDAAAGPGGPKPAGTARVELPHFTDVLADSGITFRHRFLDSETGSTYRINPYDHGSGVYVADVNGDGRDDIYFLNFLGDNALYLNRGSFRFEDITARSGVAVSRALSVGGAFGDYDDDGDQDLYVTTYRGGNHLFRNDGDANFEEVTETAKVGYNGHSSAATWLDYDLDGDLDLYLCNIGKFTRETISHEADYFFTGEALPFPTLARAPDQRNPGEPDILYRNEGDGTFTDVTREAGIDSGEWNGDVATADIDLDGDVDLYTSNMFGTNHLFRNEGNGTFTEITKESLGYTSWGGMGAKFFNGNGDEYPDLYVVDMHSDMWADQDAPEQVQQPGAKYNTPLGTSVAGGKPIRRPEDSYASAALFGNTYFENDGDGTFTERSNEAGLENWWPWGITSGDYNGDGHEDLFVPSGMGFPFFYWPNHLLVNAGDGTFIECAAEAGIEPPALGKSIAGAEIRGEAFTRSSRTAATADFDGDGDLDIVVNNFNHEPYLLRNDATGVNAVLLRLRGTKGARDAVGARVTVVAGDRRWYRQQHNAQGYLTQNSAVVHVAIGPVGSVDRVEIVWPGGGAPQIVEGPPLNQVIDVAQE